MSYLDYYFECLDIKNMPDFLNKYLKVPSLIRLKNVGYFCGMDYASKNIYNFREYISRYDHSLTVALLTYKFTQDKKATLAGLFHDVATPCFSHVIDYMNKDYETQESTEEYTEKVLKNDQDLIKYLKEDNIEIDEIINFKKYSIVDNNRPKLCADRLDGIILTGISWTKNLETQDIFRIVSNISVYHNEDDELELGFKNYDVAKLVIEINDSINKYCHSNEDNYMMELLASITKLAILKNIISYDDLYYLDEASIFNKFASDEELKEKVNQFETIKISEIPAIDLPSVKQRIINPLVDGKRSSYGKENE